MPELTAIVGLTVAVAWIYCYVLDLRGRIEDIEEIITGPDSTLDLEPVQDDRDWEEG